MLQGVRVLCEDYSSGKYCLPIASDTLLLRKDREIKLSEASILVEVGRICGRVHSLQNYHEIFAENQTL